MTAGDGTWRFAVDQGGTFTDVIGVDPEGVYHALKLLSRSPHYSDASIEGIRRMLGTGPKEPLSSHLVAGIRFGTTIATNALLERKGCPVALLVTRGFKDLLEIGDQSRRHIFRLCVKKPPPLYSLVVEVDERIDSRGTIVTGLDGKLLREQTAALREAGIEAVAVVLLHSWVNPEHELRCGDLLREAGMERTFLSHRTANHIKAVSRGQSTLVDAYLSTVLALYEEGIAAEVEGVPLQFMQSSGNLCRPGAFHGKSALFSGPAGGVVAVARVAEERGEEGLIGFDMGGTSTDVCRFDGTLEKVFEKEIAGVPLQAEMLEINTVAAGGGSTLSFDGQKLKVGPESAGSDPGPACYGLGGPLTITDANLLTGRIVPASFPETFGRERNLPPDPALSASRFRHLTAKINGTLGRSLSPEETAEGFLHIANEKMAQAIKEISVSKGFDVRQDSLLCFGGAGGQHACAIASLLGMKRIVVPPLSGLFSAYGIGVAKSAQQSSRTLLEELSPESCRRLPSLFAAMEKQLASGWAGGGPKVSSTWSLDLRPRGTEAFITLNYCPYEELLSAFHQRYHRHFGIHPGHGGIEIVSLRVENREETAFFPPLTAGTGATVRKPPPLGRRRIHYRCGPLQAPIFRRPSLPSGWKAPGPVLILDSDATIVVDPSFEAAVDSDGYLVLTRTSSESSPERGGDEEPDPVLLEVFNHLFTGVATEMGHTLRNTAHSVNMKERLDFSCALFDATGNLVANAPHIPVHLGAMADTVKAVLHKEGRSMQPGDMYISNDPYRGGSHLPDITVINPVFATGGEIIFFTGARGHHSDIGGTTPGSMPPSATHIEEEGVLIDSFLIVRGRQFRERALRELLTGLPQGVRNVGERIADFRAQIAACHRGERELRQVIDRYGLGKVMNYMRYICLSAEYMTKKSLSLFLDNNSSFSASFKDRLDDGTPIKVAVTINGGPRPPDTVTATFDFSGTGEQHGEDNLNAPLAVTRAAVLYVIRSLAESSIPLNSGSLDCLDLIVPAGTILNPLYPAPVASGNVETSQRVVDVLLGALGIAAASQGTMNNLLFEVEGEAPYYETIAGGAGAVEGCDGASGVQVHMTNTRMTDTEVLELRHPGVRLKRFTLRRGSGGSGRFPGGNGVIREVAFLRRAVVSVISERRKTEPWGQSGGGKGAAGRNLLRRADGQTVQLGHRQTLQVERGDTLIILTPGGGGYGTTGSTPANARRGQRD